MVKIRLVGTPHKPVSDRIRKILDDLDTKCLGSNYQRDGVYWWLATNEQGSQWGIADFILSMTNTDSFVGLACYQKRTAKNFNGDSSN